MAGIKINLFGYPEVSVDGKKITFARTKTLCLLAYLALNRTPQSRECLAELLWPEMDGGHARGNLRLALSELSKSIGKECLLATRNDLQLAETGGITIDIEKFNILISEYKASNDSEKLKEAVNLYRDDFMKGFICSGSRELEEWQFFEAEALRSRFSTCLEDLIRSDTRIRDQGFKIEYTGRLYRTDTFNEEYLRLYMDALWKGGQRKLAVSQFKNFEKRLRDEEDDIPDQETLDLLEKIKTEKERDNFLLPLFPKLKWSTRKGGILLFLLVMGALLLILFFLFLIFKAKPGENSIAVLPIEALCTEENAEAYAAAFTHALISNLSYNDDFNVISYTTSMEYRHSGKMIPEIAKELGVNYIVNGIVIVGGSEVRISIQLIDVRSDTCIWAEVYDRTLMEGFDLDKEIGDDIIRKIKYRLAPGGIRGVKDFTFR